MVQLPSHEYLDRLGIPYEKSEFPTSTEKGAAPVARVLGYRERQMVKILIFETDTGSRNIRMASPEAAKQMTGHVIGSIPPFSWQPQGFLEVSLMGESILGVGAGAWEMKS